MYLLRTPVSGIFFKSSVDAHAVVGGTLIVVHPQVGDVTVAVLRDDDGQVVVFPGPQQGALHHLRLDLRQNI